MEKILYIEKEEKKMRKEVTIKTTQTVNLHHQIILGKEEKDPLKPLSLGPTLTCLMTKSGSYSYMS